jgi:ATP-dependent helicase/nuclease subunit A
MSKMNSATQTPPPDQAQRQRALMPDENILVQAPAGSGKTDLLTRRFLRLLSEVDDPAQIVAITFTKAAAAEMRHRIITELEKAVGASESGGSHLNPDTFSMPALANRALDNLIKRGWLLEDLPAQMRITTIDAFCREIAIQQPLLGGLGGTLDIAAEPEELYRRAARSTLDQLATTKPAANAELLQSIEALLELQDNSWQEVEDQLVEMLGKRDRWMRDFLLQHEPDWDALRARLEQPFAVAAEQSLVAVTELFRQLPDICEEALSLARFACAQKNDGSLQALAELVELPCPPFGNSDSIDAARAAWLDLADMLLTKEGTLRKSITVRDGFPADRKLEKLRFSSMLATLCDIEALASTLHSLRMLPPARYADDEWRIIRACFTLLRHAAAQLRVVFAEAGAVDYVEVAQQALHVIQDDERMPTEAGLRIADQIRHLLVDEFQDTSRRQHQLIAAIAAAWSETSRRSVFAVGDPMQSIYLFRDADAELFPQVRTRGIDLLGGESLKFNFVRLSSNFRTAHALIQELNDFFRSVLAEGSNVIEFAEAEAARIDKGNPSPLFTFHSAFTAKGEVQSELARVTQIAEIVALIRSYSSRIEQALLRGSKFRIAVLARTTKMLVPIAAALREAGISFRAEGLEGLTARPEVLDALNLARALMNNQDRIAWLGVLRAPWCGLSLADLHILVSADDPAIRASAIPESLAYRAHLLSDSGQQAVTRLHQAVQQARIMRAAQPEAALGTWLEQVWLLLGGADCVDAEAQANLALLWQCLDALQGSEQDLLGPALDVALKDLKALPDPATESDFGVHLMTIHKSKGLEFEVVIVPEFHGQSQRTRHRMVAWLERGLSEANDAGEMTEFLIAPQQARGVDRGSAKKWVDSLYEIREKQEMKRVLYVAATRAREELHFFARMEVPAGNDKELKPRPNSLLKTAWPALQEHSESRLAAWKQESPVSQSREMSDEEYFDKPAILHRLPAGYEPPAVASMSARSSLTVQGSRSTYQRHEGGLISRALGTAVHALMAELASLHSRRDLSASQTALQSVLPRLSADIRATGIDSAEAGRIATQALEIVLQASHDTDAQWILSPHPDASSESRWTGFLDGQLRTVQADRIFRAGSAPHTEGENIWWIVDYKTIESEASLPELRQLFQPQLDLYARLLHLLHGPDVEVHAGLYYPGMRLFDWWKA